MFNCQYTLQEAKFLSDQIQKDSSGHLHNCGHNIRAEFGNNICSSEKVAELCSGLVADIPIFDLFSCFTPFTGTEPSLLI